MVCAGNGANTEGADHTFVIPLPVNNKKKAYTFRNGCYNKGGTIKSEVYTQRTLITLHQAHYTYCCYLRAACLC